MQLDFTRGSKPARLNLPASFGLGFNLAWGLAFTASFLHTVDDQGVRRWTRLVDHALS